MAKAAGVSPATVSRVLNHPDIVRPDLQAKVRRAIAELGYAPDAMARALSLGRSNTIGAIIPTLGMTIFANGTVALQKRLREYNYTLLIANAEYDPERELEEIKVLLERGVDGLVLVGDRMSAEALALARQYQVPLVTTYVSESQFSVPAIGIDNAEAMHQVLQMLLDLGHREFGVITVYPAHNDRQQARRQGVFAAFEAADIPLAAHRIAEVPYSVAHGRTAFKRLITADPAITAVICSSDAFAIGALAECKYLGLSVPRDISITGYDDVDISMHTDPPLTTVNVPAAVIGRLAADHLVATLNGRPPPLTTKLPAQIIVRGSTAAPRSARKS
ncbi:LacI family DNA-binding transcriptional regulator [Aureimonas fodinaquatilis]|uniref:LacI family DNA-binding transcriptional regulator n=1 Tax=Aureimonas fodinaquatilis TaxID=2565783 RepID=UPI001FECEA72|nr:LacI family DNA-binding transcriptional regulator [Aureimonas fodinaquatilis]